MLNFGWEKLLLVGVIALLVLGPERLPQAARSFGKLLADLRRVSAGFQEEVRGALSEPVDVMKSMAGDLHIPDIRRTVRETITGASTPSPASNGSQPQPTVEVQGGFGGMPPVPDDPGLN